MNKNPKQYVLFTILVLVFGIIATIVGVLGAARTVDTGALLPIAAGIMIISGGLVFFIFKK